jgi:hypothetical protein
VCVCVVVDEKGRVALCAREKQFGGGQYP